jgi:hypothetical protein
VPIRSQINCPFRTKRFRQGRQHGITHDWVMFGQHANLRVINAKLVCVSWFFLV